PRRRPNGSATPTVRGRRAVGRVTAGGAALGAVAETLVTGLQRRREEQLARLLTAEVVEPRGARAGVSALGMLLGVAAVVQHAAEGGRAASGVRGRAPVDAVLAAVGAVEGVPLAGAEGVAR